MTNYKDLIEQLNLFDETDRPEGLKDVRHFSMDAADLESDTEHRKYKNHEGPDNRGKYERTLEHRAAKSQMMQELWSDPEFREKMKHCQTGRPHKTRGPYEANKPHVYKWSEKDRQALSDRQKDTILITDGVECHRHKIYEPIPEGWWRGKPGPSEESKRKTSETMKRLWREYKERQNND